MSTVAESRIAETVDRYLAAWNERNPGRRRALIADTWVEQGYYVDPHRRGDSHDGIDAMIGAVQERFPTYRFRLSGAVVPTTTASASRGKRAGPTMHRCTSSAPTSAYSPRTVVSNPSPASST